MCGPSDWKASTWARQVVSASGKLKSLKVQLDGPPGAGKSYKFTLMIGAIPQTLEVIISGAVDTYGEDVVNEVVISPGDLISLRCDPDGTPDFARAYWTSIFEGDNPNESLILGLTSGILLDSSNIEYVSIQNGGFTPSVTENDHREVAPTGGIISDLFVELTSDPGTDPDAYRFTVRLNGVTVAQSLIVTIIANDKTGSDLVHNLVVVAGDVLTLMIEPLNTPSVTPAAKWGMTFTATIDGEAIVMGGSTDDLSNFQTHYAYPHLYTAWGAGETGLHLGQTCTVKKLHILLTGVPGAGNKYTFTIRLGLASSNVVTEVSGGVAITGDSGALEDDIAAHEYIGLMCVPDSNPTIRDAYWGFVVYRAPAPEGGAGASVMSTKSLIHNLLLTDMI